MVTILMMSTKMANLDLLKINVFYNKGYDIIIPVSDLTNKILSHGSNYTVKRSYDQNLITLAFLWGKLSKPQFYKDFTRKTPFFEG